MDIGPAEAGMGAGDDGDSEVGEPGMGRQRRRIKVKSSW